MSLRTAVIGGGTVSENHLSGLAQNPKTELVAICDLDEETARSKARSYGIKAYFDVDELLDAEQLDWIHVCTPPQTHLAVATQTLEAGIPTLVEKPVTETIEQFEDLAAVAEREDVPFSVVHNHKFGLVMRSVLEEIESGELGQIRGVDLLYTGSTEPESKTVEPGTSSCSAVSSKRGFPIRCISGSMPAGFHEAMRMCRRRVVSSASTRWISATTARRFST